MKEELTTKAKSLMLQSFHLAKVPEQRNASSEYHCEVCEDEVFIPMRRWKGTKDVLILESDFFGGRVNPSEASNWNEKYYFRCYCEKEKQRRKELEKYSTESGLSKRFQKRTFDMFTIVDPEDYMSDVRQEAESLAESQAAALKIARNYVRNYSSFKEGESVGLLGDYGTGKTHLLAAMTNELSRSGVKAMYINTTEFFETLKETFEKDENGKYIMTTRASEHIDQVKTCDHLSLDDVGKEKPSDFVHTVFYRIINYRYENLMPTNFTTNCSLDQLEKQVGSATYRRLIEPAVGRMKDLKGESYEQLQLRRK